MKLSAGTGKDVDSVSIVPYVDGANIVYIVNITR
jgi:hypothetical protein